jgi:hypothetical protein
MRAAGARVARIARAAPVCDEGNRTIPPRGIVAAARRRTQVHAFAFPFVFVDVVILGRATKSCTALRIRRSSVLRSRGVIVWHLASTASVTTFVRLITRNCTCGSSSLFFLAIAPLIFATIAWVENEANGSIAAEGDPQKLTRLQQIARGARPFASLKLT